ncbi:MAG: RES family NAD+ phosphorylase [Azospirillaceae bacterium]
MSSPIWTPAALSSETRPFQGEIWRLVEAQHRVSTMGLVDDLVEQDLLERLLEETKPPVPPECRHLDYLLAAPFRYGRYPDDSRFRRRGGSAGVFYGAPSVRTAVAELSFYRVLFFAESPETPFPDSATEFTAFTAAIATDRAIDLTRPPFDADQARWGHPVDYGPCLALADAARQAAVEAIGYRSVRDPAGGDNLAVLTCAAFARPSPVRRQTWRLLVAASGVRAIAEFPPDRCAFAPEDFASDPRLAGMAWRRVSGD